MKNEDYKQLLEKICTLVENDFCADMEVRTMTTDGKYPEITQEESRKMIDNETKKLLYGSFFRGTIVQKKAYDEEVTGEFKSENDIDKFFLEKYNV